MTNLIIRGLVYALLLGGIVIGYFFVATGWFPSAEIDGIPRSFTKGSPPQAANLKMPNEFAKNFADAWPAFSCDSALLSAIAEHLPNDAHGLGDDVRAISNQPQRWFAALSGLIANQDSDIRSGGIEQALSVHELLVNDTSLEDDSKPVLAQEIERYLIEAAINETDPLLLEKHFIPFLAAIPAEKALPVLEHLLTVNFPSETLAVAIETLIDGGMWTLHQAETWLRQSNLNNEDTTELMAELHQAFPDATFNHAGGVEAM